MQVYEVDEVEEERSLEVSLDPNCLEEPSLEEEKIPGFPGPSSSWSTWVNTKTVGLQVTKCWLTWDHHHHHHQRHHHHYHHHHHRNHQRLH